MNQFIKQDLSQDKIDSSELGQDGLGVQSYHPEPTTQEVKEKKPSSLWEIRTQEQDYAFLSDKNSKKENRYGQRIDLLDITDSPKDRPLYINENPEVGCNPNRNKQHGFFFTADNCIGCHACEAACSEKNENPAHIAFRSVGYLEGGSYPDYQRMNISMACNHCDDPVCLKGCPTRAYTKHAEYGAVLQDPETCFGCGYCTWVCPYNAPQLDPVQGQVSKCNMCVDRLEVGLKPACVSACVGNALDFGVIENTPENREQCKTHIPGFPDPEITHPNIRFQQTKGLANEMKRTDSAPVKYHQEDNGGYSPMVDQKLGLTKHWNLAKLNSRENPLVLFTLFAQAAFGFFAIPFISALAGIDSFVRLLASDFFILQPVIALIMMSFALLMSVTHLGKPFRFYRGFNNLRYSPMSREGFGLALFCAGCGLTAILALPANTWLNTLLYARFAFDLSPVSQLSSTLASITGMFALVAGLGGLFYMNKCYQIKARPFWNHWQTATSFAGNSLSIGAFFGALLLVPVLFFTAKDTVLVDQATVIFSSCFFAGMLIEAMGLIAHHKAMSNRQNEGAASHYVQRTTFGKSYLLRNVLLALNILGALFLLMLQLSGYQAASLLPAWLALGLVNCLTAAIGRALFYILVIPTTMPGAFFWKNKGFEQHARDTGLADNPAAGIAPDIH